MPKITIDTTNLPMGCRTPDKLRVLANTHDVRQRPVTAAIINLIADAMPEPLPTMPGSQVWCDGDEWTMMRDGVYWHCYTANRPACFSEDLAALGPYEVIRDAGVGKA